MMKRTNIQICGSKFFKGNLPKNNKKTKGKLPKKIVGQNNVS